MFATLCQHTFSPLLHQADKEPHKAACALRQQQQHADCVMMNRDVRKQQ